ncbi:Pre-mRNA-splicing factor SYF2 [Camelus dromedarius]|uniref:Pre-mRNA-splicing factor SYF2 n=1 Tax=Camelus dromedarius TaxID=9838 RepID=A0A5N4DBJ5_CAMDR|nr:Pre-mRNA-splicing factor SYF2 [Camelus dromedarius]
MTYSKPRPFLAVLGTWDQSLPRLAVNRFRLGRALRSRRGKGGAEREEPGTSREPLLLIGNSQVGPASSLPSSPQGPVGGAAELAAQKREQRLRKFRELHLKPEVVKEDKRLKLPANWEAKKARLEWKERKKNVQQGGKTEKVKLLEISAEDAERWEKKKEEKPDLGFSVESSSTQHLTVFFIDHIIEKRDKYSRRHPYNDDADIDYINERNAKFNKKAERFYGKYTAEIKQNLERGTAV